MTKRIVNKGDKFNRLTIVEEIEPFVCGKPRRRFLCKCDCGNDKITLLSALTTNQVQSCGCLNVERTLESHITHNMTRHRLYKTWNGMMLRCYKENNKDYPNYGGRGIKVCDEWHSIEVFLQDMYPSFQEGLTLDRKDNNGNYCKENCKWSTAKEQLSNTRSTLKVLYNGVIYTANDLSLKLGKSRTYISQLLRQGKTLPGLEIITKEV